MHYLERLFTHIFYFVDIKDGNKQPLYLFLLMLMYGLAFLPYMYAVQFAFTGPATGYVVMVFVNLLTGMIVYKLHCLCEN